MYQNSQNKGTEFLIPDYNLFDIGLFAIAKKSWNKLDISGGLRYDSRTENGKDFGSMKTDQRLQFLMLIHCINSTQFNADFGEYQAVSELHISLVRRFYQIEYLERIPVAKHCWDFCKWSTFLKELSTTSSVHLHWKLRIVCSWIMPWDWIPSMLQRRLICFTTISRTTSTFKTWGWMALIHWLMVSVHLNTHPEMLICWEEKFQLTFILTLWIGCTLKIVLPMCNQFRQTNLIQWNISRLLRRQNFLLN